MDIDEKLISLVKEHECLYNVNSRNYIDKNSKQNAWDEISNEMGISGKNWFCSAKMVKSFNKSIDLLFTSFIILRHVCKVRYDY